MKEIRILVAARRDLMAGYRFYEKQAPGIGRYFLDTMYSDIESLRIHAGVHALYFGDYHRLLSKRFPWSVYFKLPVGEQAGLRTCLVPAIGEALQALWSMNQEPRFQASPTVARCTGRWRERS